MKCVICKKEIESKEFIPFCSSRCRNIDLNRWLEEVYVVPDSVMSDSVAPSDVATDNNAGNNVEKSAGQDSKIDLYENMNCPDSSVGRAED